MDSQATFGGDEYFRQLEKLLSKAKTQRKLQEVIVNAPFHDRRTTTMLGLGIIVLLLVNKEDGTIDRVALANTELARGTTSISSKKFEEIRIPVGYTRNFIARAIREQHYMITSDWQYMFNPVLTAEEARFNQAGGGIACSVIYPLPHALDGAAMIFSYYEPIERIGKEHHNFMARYSSIAQQAIQKLP